MTFLQLIALRIHRLLIARRWSQYELAKRSGVPLSTLSTILKKKGKSINSETLINICRGFDMRVVDFFNDEMFEPENILDN